jgi:dienelactone hydrolase
MRRAMRRARSSSEDRRLPLLAACLVLSLVARAAVAADGHGRIVISPAKVLEGDPVSIEVKDLVPGASATLRARSVMQGEDGKQQLYASEATFIADAQGAVDLATAAPVAGDYRGADLRGLFWSERPVTVAALDGGRAPASGEVVLTLDVAGVRLDEEALTFITGLDLRREAVRAGGLVGVFYHANGATRCPVVVVLGGSEGGLDVADWVGPKLAARGYAVLGVDYFNPPGDEVVAGVPTALEHIPVELLQKARAWLKRRRQADVTRFGVLGYSKGGEFTLLLASTYRWIDAAVAYAPADYVWQGIVYGGGPAGSSWTRAGRDLPFLPTTGTRAVIQAARRSGGKVTLAAVAKSNIAAASPQMREAARIKLERSHAALLLIGGGDDQLWDSGASVARFAVALKRAAYARPYEALIYPRAGHDLIGSGWRPTTGDSAGFFRDGGTPAADARAQADSWAKVLDFLRRELRP